MVDFHEIAQRWQKKWEEKKLFEPSILPEKKKFFVTFPYPYMSGMLHLGHSYTSTRVEVMARYKRMQGYNVLFPQGFHATGSPLETAAKRVKEKEQGQLQALKLMGIKEEEFKKFEEPEYWAKKFSQEAEKDFRDLGLSIDWRRKFITTDLNPKYSKFIQWQFNKLFEKEYVLQGEHPVVWCPKENAPVGDHARSEGEGEMPEEMTVIKFIMTQGEEEIIFPCATYRPETTYGVTNIWINPNIDYAKTSVNGETWIISQECAKKLADQKYSIEVIEKISGRDLLGKQATNQITKNKIYILPANFVKPDNATGIVMSVPSHAPFDYIALEELKEYSHKFGIKKELLDQIQPISLIKVEGYKEHPAIEICQQLGIKSQSDKKLEEATKEIYKKEYHTGKLKEITGKYKGLTVQEAKPKIIADLTKKNFATKIFELSKPVICRCLAKCHVKIVDDQWFLAYGKEEWKAKTFRCLEQMKLYPEKSRPQFEYVIDWLKDWACTREFGLGTKLPWDKKWVIESLSDSTLYMAYYTINHLLNEIPLEKINDDLFDYVFLGKGDLKKITADKKTLQKMKDEFNYWYPVDFRNSGKDLVQNHLAFYMFNHTAILSEKQWPKGIGVNGYVNINKQKMSKSKGIFKTLRDLIKTYSPDITRITVLSGGEELNDVDWDDDFATTIKLRLENFYDFALENYGNGINEERQIDKWMTSKINDVIKKTTYCMEETLYRTAIMTAFFDLQRYFKWYQRRSAGKYNKQVLTDIIEGQIKLLTPITPHYCEELWFKIGKQGFVSLEKWPETDLSKINSELDKIEELIEQTMEDISSVLKIAKIEKPKKITLFVAQDWKGLLIKEVKTQLKNTRNVGDIIKAIMQTSLKETQDKQSLSGHSRIYSASEASEVTSLIPRLIKNEGKLPEHVMHQEAEHAFLEQSKEFLQKEYGCIIEIVKEQESTEQKAKQSMPAKPAILVI